MQLPNYADEIKDKITMHDVCRAYGIRVNRAGKAVCPFHNDNRPSMHVYGGQRGWYCFVCDEGGDIISFAQKFFGLDFQSACARLNTDFCLGLPIGVELNLREFRAAEKSARERKARLEAEKAEYQKLIDDYHKALDNYINYDRQRIQYAPDRLSGGIIDFYAEAAKGIAVAEDALEEAETRLYEYEHNRPRD